MEDRRDEIYLYNGDCLELMDAIPDHSVQLILADLPYGTTARNKWDIVIPLDALWKQYKRIIKENGVIALWSQIPFSGMLMASNPKMLRYEWIIEKKAATGFLNAKRMPLKAHENVLIFYDKLPKYNPQITHGHKRKVSTTKHKLSSKQSTDYGKYPLTDYDSTDRYPRDVLCFSWGEKKGRLHPTQKPVEACEYFIRTYTDEGDLVLDNCMGSGTTGVACMNTKRRFIGMELNESYYETAKKRIGYEVKRNEK